MSLPAAIYCGARLCGVNRPYRLVWEGRRVRVRCGHCGGDLGLAPDSDRWREAAGPKPKPKPKAETPSLFGGE